MASGLDQIILRIKRRDSTVARFAYDAYKLLQGFDVPDNEAMRILFGGMLLYTHLVWGLNLEGFFGPDGWQGTTVVRTLESCAARANACVSINSRMWASLPSRTVMSKTKWSSNALFVAVIFPLAKPMTRTRSPCATNSGGSG